MLNNNTITIESPLMKYKEERKTEYQSVESQLDMLWHELKESGSISREGMWYQKLAATKSMFPKPPVEEPTE